MIRLKLIIALFTILIGPATMAQNLDEKSSLLQLLKSKHDYEKNLQTKNPNAIASKAVYFKAYNEMRLKKTDVLDYIDKAIKKDSTLLMAKNIFYKYNDPLDSNYSPKNLISLLTYFKIVKYSLNNEQEILPAVEHVPMNIRSKH